MVTNLIYYTDTIAFYKQHKEYIKPLLRDTLDDYGYESPNQLFGNKWDNTDIFCEESTNMNLLSWFAFEEYCRNKLDKMET